MTPDAPQDQPPAKDGDATGPAAPDAPTRQRPDGSTPTGSISPSTGDLWSVIFDSPPASRPANDELVGTVIGDTRIIRVIGQGGMGRVYEGYQERLALTVAVKVMRPGLVATPGMQQQFDYEAKILARLQHPGIARIFSAGVEPLLGAQVPYFIMDYIPEARTLTRYAEDLKLPTRLRLDLFRKVCDAVAHGHQNGIVHRDLKPSNILVDAKGQPKVIDFGVAKATDSDLALKMLQPNLNWIMGTFQYMAPEQIEGNPNLIDIRCDVYALGVVLYELLTGQLPYDVRQKAIEEAKRIVQEAQPTPIVAFDKTLRGDVDGIAGKCLEKDRERRYASASALGEDVGRHLDGEPPTAVRQSLIRKIRWLARKHRAAVAATVGVFAALVAAVIGISTFYLIADAERLAADKARVTAEAAESVAKQEKEVAATRFHEANLFRIEKILNEGNFPVARYLLAEEVTTFAGKALPIELTCIDAKLNAHMTICKGHDDQIVRITFSPDGTKIATGSRDGTARLWDANTGSQLLVLEGYVVAPQGYGEAPQIEFSPDGTKVATASESGTIQLWDVNTGNQLVSIEGLEKKSCSFSFSLDGTRIAMGSFDGTTLLWDVITGSRLATLKGGHVNGDESCFSADGTKIATESFIKGDWRVWVWDSRTGMQLASIDGHGPIFSADGTKLTTRSGNIVRLWDVNTGKQLLELKGHPEGISQLALSPDGTKIATGSGDGTTQLWDANTGSLLAAFKGHGDRVDKLAFSADGMRLATGSQDGTAKLWDTSTGEELYDFYFHRDIVSPDGTKITSSPHLWDFRSFVVLQHRHRRSSSQLLGELSPDGTTIATVSSGHDVLIWDADMANLSDIKGSEAAFSPDGTKIATLSGNAVRLWDSCTCRQLATLDGHDGAIGMLAFSQDGSTIATEAEDKILRLWDTNTGRQLAAIEVPDDAITTVGFSPDGTKVATGSNDSVVRIWRANTGDQLLELKWQKTCILQIAFSPDGTKIAAGSGDGAAQLWDANTGSQLAVFQGHCNSVAAIVFSVDGTRLAIGSQDGTVQLWDVTTGTKLASLEGHEDSISQLTFSPDGKKIATGSHDWTACIWDATTGLKLVGLKGHKGAVARLAFSPNGSRLATSANDGTTRIWDVTTGSQLSSLERASFNGVHTLAFRPDGSALATGSPASSFDVPKIRLWGLSNAEIYRARLNADAIEKRLDGTIAEWLTLGPDAAVAKLRSSRSTMSPEDFRVSGNMILARSYAMTKKCETFPRNSEPIPQSFSGRSRSSAVDRAIEWLSAHQLENGTWTFDLRECPNCKGQCDGWGTYADRAGATAVALLPYLGRGYNHCEGPYKKGVERGLAFLARKSLLKEGAIYSPGSHESLIQAFGTLVLCEAYSQTEDTRLLPAAQLAIDHIAVLQDPTSGGWAYARGQPSCTVATCMNLLALKSGHLAGMRVKSATFNRGLDFLEAMEVDGGVSYRHSSSEAVSDLATAAGLAGRISLGWRSDYDVFDRCSRRYASVKPSRDPMTGFLSQLYMCHASDVLSTDEDFRQWNYRCRSLLLPAQIKDGHMGGSWGEGLSSDVLFDGGRLYRTAMTVLTHEVYYRHLPIFRAQAASRPVEGMEWQPVVAEDPGTLSAYSDSIGKEFVFRVRGSRAGGLVKGRNPYTLDSHLATAAVRAHVVNPGEWRDVRVSILRGRQSYFSKTGDRDHDDSHRGETIEAVYKVSPYSSYKEPSAAEVFTSEPLVNSIGMKLKLIPAGKFLMGSQHGEPNESPVHFVQIEKPFYLGIYEVTNAQWKAVMGGVPSRWTDDDRPVERVSWDEAIVFCRKLSELPDEKIAERVYRLPTEAEWEYACRAGRTTAFSFGDDARNLYKYAWFRDNSKTDGMNACELGPVDQKDGKPASEVSPLEAIFSWSSHAVGRKYPNRWGLHDMHGNVYEWCSDLYSTYPLGRATDPQGPSEGSTRVYRGGCSSSRSSECRSASRSGFGSADGEDFVGVRVVLIQSPSTLPVTGK